MQLRGDRNDKRRFVCCKKQMWCRWSPKALDAMPASDHLTFLVNEHGRPFPAVNVSAWFRDCCAEAGVPAGYTPHGLRKASAKMHADRGATTHMLMAWHGWLSIGEAERYTRGADRRLLSAAAGSPSPTKNVCGVSKCLTRPKVGQLVVQAVEIVTLREAVPMPAGHGLHRSDSDRLVVHHKAHEGHREGWCSKMPPSRPSCLRGESASAPAGHGVHRPGLSAPRRPLLRVSYPPPDPDSRWKWGRSPILN
jgi:hypothetical protein